MLLGCHRGLSLSRSSCRTRSTQAFQRVIASKNAPINALVYTSPSPKTEDLPLSELSVAIKDNICTASMPTTCSSAMLKGFTPPLDATVVKALHNAGAQIIGKTNCDEFGMGSLNLYSVHGPVLNPHQPPNSSSTPRDAEPRLAGGSSGGSAAVVAAGICDAALATDTGGSTRLPASYCGVVGLKPSYGLISRWGVVSFADSLDCVGVVAKDVASTKRVFDVLSFYDPKDPTAATPETRHKASKALEKEAISRDLGHELTNLRVGVPLEYFPKELSASIITPLRSIISKLHSLGASIIPVSLPSTSYALSAYYVIASAEASSNMARYDGIQYGTRPDTPPDTDCSAPAKVYARTRSTGLGEEVKKRILLGAYALTADAFDNYFLQAQRVRNRVKQDFRNVFRMQDVLSSGPCSPSTVHSPQVDVLIHPSAIRTAPPLPSSSTPELSAPLDMYVQDVLTVPASLAGLPALHVPMGLAQDGWPVGVSVVGQWGSDPFVLQVGEIIEKLVRSA